MSLSGTFSDDGATAYLLLRPKESFTLSLTLAGADTFIGRVILEETNDQVVNRTAQDILGADMDFEYVDADNKSGTIVATTIRNESNSRKYYRLVVTGFDDDNLVYAMTETVGDMIETVLSDRSGVPVIGKRDDGTYVMLAPLTQSEILWGAGVEELLAEGTISAADIIATTAGKFGHAAGYPMVADPGAGYIAELISCACIFDRDTAAYTDGGNITVNENGGAALTGLVSAANSLGNAADKYATFTPLSTAAIVRTANKGLNLVSSAAFTNPGTAAGVIRYKCRYRVISLSV